MALRTLDSLLVAQENCGEKRFIAEGSKRIGEIKSFLDKTDTHFKIEYNTLMDGIKITPLVFDEYEDVEGKKYRIAGIIYSRKNGDANSNLDEDHTVIMEVLALNQEYRVEQGKLKRKK